MSTLNKALKSLQMIKFARSTHFYWGSMFDPHADAYDATKQELMNAQDALKQNDAHTHYVIDGKNFNINDVDNAFNNAWNANEALAQQRRNYYRLPVLSGAAIGATGLGLGGYFGGDWIANQLGFGRRGRTNAAIIGALLGAGTGAYAGSTFAGNLYSNSERAPRFNNGSEVLDNLNTAITALAPGYDPNDRNASTIKLVDSTKPDKAREEARNRR